MIDSKFIKLLLMLYLTYFINLHCAYHNDGISRLNFVESEIKITNLVYLDDEHIAVSYENGTLKVLNVDNLMEATFELTSKYEITHVLRCKNCLVTGSKAGIITVWKFNSAKRLLEPVYVTQIAWLSRITNLIEINDKLIANVDKEVIEIWDIQARKKVTKIEEPALFKTNIIAAKKLTHDKFALINEKAIVIILLNETESLESDSYIVDGYFKLTNNSQITSLISPTNNIIIAGDIDGYITIYDLSDLANIKILDYRHAHTKAVTCLTDLGDKKIASGSYDETIKLWDLKNLRKIRNIGTLNDHFGAVSNILRLEDDAIASGDFFSVKIWDLTKLGLPKATLLTGQSYVKFLLKMNGKLISATNTCIATWVEESSR